MKVLITGTAGFIGFHLAQRLILEGHEIIGVDNVNDYYDIRVKLGRLELHGIDSASMRKDPFPGSGIVHQSIKYPNYKFVRLDISNYEKISRLFEREGFDCVCSLAAQAGVRYSLTNPWAYVDSNIHGFLSILEACRHYKIKHLVFASSSSVYGLNEAMPFSTSHNVDHPVSLYAASKKTNELMAHTYSHLYRIPTTGLRFFTAYGPWGRPDMALFLFIKAILEDKPINVFNNGNMKRDFTYIDDIIEGIIRVIQKPPKGDTGWSAEKPDPGSSSAPYKIYNVGNSRPVQLMDFISAIEKALGKTAVKNFLPLQDGDVPATWADTVDLERDMGYRPQTSIEDGVRKFIEWYKSFFGV